MKELVRHARLPTWELALGLCLPAPPQITPGTGKATAEVTFFSIEDDSLLVVTRDRCTCAHLGLGNPERRASHRTSATEPRGSRDPCSTSVGRVHHYFGDTSVRSRRTIQKGLGVPFLDDLKRVPSGRGVIHVAAINHVADPSRSGDPCMDRVRCHLRRFRDPRRGAVGYRRGLLAPQDLAFRRSWRQALARKRPTGSRAARQGRGVPARVEGPGASVGPSDPARGARGRGREDVDVHPRSRGSSGDLRGAWA